MDLKGRGASKGQRGQGLKMTSVHGLKFTPQGLQKDWRDLKGTCKRRDSKRNQKGLERDIKTDL